MWFLRGLADQLHTLTVKFLAAYLTVSGWVWPFSLLATPLYYIYYAFLYTEYYFSKFADWVEDAANKLLAILDWSVIWSYLLYWLPNLTNLNTWFYSWWSEVTSAVSSWWSGTQYTVQGWINTAKQFLQTQINSLSTWIATLQADVQELLANLPSLEEILNWFGNWWANILTEIEAWWNGKLLGVQGLINSTLRDWFPFYDELAGLWSDIKLFFTDPLQWLYNELDEFFERFW